MITQIVWGTLGVIGLFLLVWLLLSSIVVIRGDEVGVVERKYFGKQLPKDRVVAMDGEIGYQARTIGPGLHLMVPFIYSVKKQGFINIKEDQVGLVEVIDGSPLEHGQIFGRSVVGHNKYQNAEIFLANGGQKGPQVETIPPGTYRINTFLFKITATSPIVIPKGQIGLVHAIDGLPMDQGRLLGRSISGHQNYQDGNAFLVNGGQKGPQMDILLPGTYRINTDLFKVTLANAAIIPAGQVGLVTANDGQPLPEKELIAQSVTNHDNYQNCSAFLANGGQRGPQRDVLPPGTYYINPYMFSIETDSAAVVNQGQVAVIVSNIGEEPVVATAEAGATDNVERYVVPAGFRGIQKEVVGPGTYYINRRAIKPVIVDTTNNTIDWDDGHDTRFDQLKVVSKDGFEISVGVKVVIRVQPEQAPYMVARIGSLDNLITNVIHPLIDSSFRNQASTASAMQFMQDRHNQQEEALKRAVSELSQYHVEILSVLICQISLPTELMETQTNKVLADQKQSMFEQQKMAEIKRIDMEKTKAQANKQSDLVTAEINVQIATQKKQEAITIAEGESEKLKLEGQGKAAAILEVGKATAEAYTLAQNAVGREGLVTIETMKLIASGQVKITPEVQVSGTNGSLVDVLLANMARSEIASTQE